MSSNTLTQAQREVVAHRGSALLVSAAAGSGKTRVLVERLLAAVCDERDPCDLQDFLIITFTEAAASELRDKIAREIGERLAQDGGNAHLRRQLTQLYLAQISTVHAFCAGILREFAHVLDIPADFRIADRTESDALQERAMELALDSAYRDLGERVELRAFFDTLGSGRDDSKAAKMILDAYKKTQCHARPARWLAECREAVAAQQYTAIDETPWGRSLMAASSRRFAQMAQVTEAALRIVEDEPGLEKYLGNFTDELELLRKWRDARTWDERHALCAAGYADLKKIVNCSCPELKDKVQRIRNACKEDLAGQKNIYALSGADALRELRASGLPVQGLLELLERFTASYDALKAQRRILDFSDLEHRAVELLLDRYDEPTPVAREIAQRYREVMVDEYQDSSAVQDSIYRAVSRGGRNLFMVGDVKQSIYRFRLADPSIFLRKYEDYATQGNFENGRKILLARNFRSAPVILDAVNHVFRTNMSREVGGLAYEDAEYLRPRENYPADAECGVELHCINSKDAQTGRAVDKSELEARFVARRITELLDGTHTFTDRDGVKQELKAEHIAILMRSPGRSVPTWLRVLQRSGIDVVCDRDDNIFDSTEIATLMGYLEIIQNPHQDIPLITAMASPIGGFTADELAQLRGSDHKRDLYDDLLANAPGREKCEAFLRRLEALRLRRRWMRLPDLLDHVIESLGFTVVFGAMQDGAGRLLNLQRFREIVNAARSAGVTELGGFLRYAERLRESGAQAGVQTRAGAVTLTSTHKSKGLEYPVVFLCDLSHEFSNEDLKQEVLFDPELYAGANVMDRVLMAKYPGVARCALRERISAGNVSEEMRILYVGMTRAMQRLVMVYTSSKLDSKLRSAAAHASMPVLPYYTANVGSEGDWVLLAAALRREASALFPDAPVCADIEGDPWHVAIHTAEEILPAQGQTSGQTRLPPRIDRACVSHDYPHLAAARLPAKLTATQLKGSAPESESAELAEQLLRRSPPGVRRALPTGMTASEQGTATHRFLQFCRFGSCADAAGVEAEKRRMVDLAFLTPEQADCVDPAKIVRFFTSELGALVRAERGVRREFKFSLLVRAPELLPGAPEEEIMLQGVVDCFVEEADGLTVVDFKTDRIRPGGEAERAERYRPQLATYALALERIFGKSVKRRLLYFFETGSACEV